MPRGKTSKALFWKLLERFGVQGVQFVLQIVLARLLDPEHYGALSIMIIFTTLANVFVQSGFNTALIQNKDVTEDDYSSVFWLTFGIAGLMYAVLFFTAPVISDIYNMPYIVTPFRVLALMLFPGAFNSVQLAKVSRKLDFKKIFYSSIGAVILSGAVGVVMAYLNFGVWALVAQNLVSTAVAVVIMLFTVKWYPRFVCDLGRVKILFRFGWKLLVSGLMDTFYQDIRSLVIGIKYNSSTLAFYNRGKQFPQFIINGVNGAVQSVMLPAMSQRQENRQQVKAMMRSSIMLSSYIIFPIMAGLAGVAESTVRLLLTEKWLPCVPYMQIYCFTLAFYPVHSCNLQAINAMGRSDIFLKLEIIKKSYGLIAIIIAIAFFDSPIAIAMTGAVTTLISCVVNAFPNKKLIDYSYLEQMKDILPSFGASILMLICVLLVGEIGFNPMSTLVLQMLVGVIVYMGISVVLKMSPFMQLLDILKSKKEKKQYAKPEI